MYEVTITIELPGSVFENVKYVRTLKLMFADIIDANRTMDHCRKKGFSTSYKFIEVYDSSLDAIDEIERNIKEMKI